MGNGFKESNRVMAFGKASKTSHISVNGWKIRHRVMEFTLGAMETSMKENGKLTLDMEMDLTSSRMVIATAVCTCLGNQKGLGSIDGPMALFIKESSGTDWSMAMANGESNQIKAVSKRIRVWATLVGWVRSEPTHIKASISKIKSMGREYLSGKVATYTMGLITMMNDKGMELWRGQMAALTWALGTRESNKESDLWCLPTAANAEVSLSRTCSSVA